MWPPGGQHPQVEEVVLGDLQQPLVLPGVQVVVAHPQPECRFPEHDVDDGPRVPFAQRLLTQHPDLHVCSDLFLAQVRGAAEVHGEGVVRGLQQAVDHVGLVGPDLGGVSLQVQVDVETTGQALPVGLPPALLGGGDRQVAQRLDRLGVRPVQATQLVDVAGAHRRAAVLDRLQLAPGEQTGGRDVLTGLPAGLPQRSQLPPELATDHRRTASRGRRPGPRHVCLPSVLILRPAQHAPTTSSPANRPVDRQLLAVAPSSPGRDALRGGPAPSPVDRSTAPGRRCSRSRRAFPCVGCVCASAPLPPVEGIEGRPHLQGVNAMTSPHHRRRTADRAPAPADVPVRVWRPRPVTPEELDDARAILVVHRLDPQVGRCAACAADCPCPPVPAEVLIVLATARNLSVPEVRSVVARDAPSP
jgi:hypothetical protein